MQLGYAKKSVLAGAWLLCCQTPPRFPGVCLRGEGRLEEAVMRQWVEFYLVRIKMETAWDTLSKDQLQAVLEVSYKYHRNTIQFLRLLFFPPNDYCAIVFSLLCTLQELDQHLSDKIFMIGYKLCLADILLYYGLHRYLVCICLLYIQHEFYCYCKRTVRGLREDYNFIGCFSEFIFIV